MIVHDRNATVQKAYLLDLAITEYREARDLQLAAVAARITGRLPADLVIMLEHPPVYTLGRRGGLDNLAVDESFLETKGIRVEPIERGGDITYHGPGQLVVYPIVNLNANRIKVVDYVCSLEEAMVRTVARWGITASGDAVNRGAWIGRRKLGSIGITVRRGVAFHGLALNVNTDLTPFEWINPCGIKDCEMTSMARECGRTISMVSARKCMQQQLADILRMDFKPIDLETLKHHL